MKVYIAVKALSFFCNGKWNDECCYVQRVFLSYKAAVKYATSKGYTKFIEREDANAIDRWVSELKIDDEYSKSRMSIEQHELHLFK